MGKIDFATFGGNYSESEIDTNYTWVDGKYTWVDGKYTWVDGKKIYKKTILFASLSNASNVSANHNIVGLADIINITGLTCQNNNRWRALNMPAGNVSTQWTIVEIDETKVYVYSGNDQRSQRASITLYYTKQSQ